MNYLRAAHNWGHVAVRAAFYGPLGCIGALTKKLQPLSRWCMYRWCSGSADALNINRTLINPDRLENPKQAVIVANHLSSLDILVLGAYIKHDFRWLAKASLFRVPFSGWFLTAAGHIPVHRDTGDQNTREQLNTHIHNVVEDGASVLFFPEGTRSETGQLKPFKLGAFITAIREDLPVFPVVIQGTHELMEKNAPDLSVHPDRSCSVTLLDHIPVERAGDGDIMARAARLRDLTHAAMKAELNSASQDEPNG